MVRQEDPYIPPAAWVTQQPFCSTCYSYPKKRPTGLDFHLENPKLTADATLHRISDMLIRQTGLSLQGL